MRTKDSNFRVMSWISFNMTYYDRVFMRNNIFFMVWHFVVFVNINDIYNMVSKKDIWVLLTIFIRSFSSIVCHLNHFLPRKRVIMIDPCDYLYFCKNATQIQIKASATIKSFYHLEMSPFNSYHLELRDMHLSC